MTELGKNYRLPSSVQVRRYAPTLRIDLEADTFAGRMRAELSLDQPSREVRLHALELQVSSAFADVAGERRAATVDVDEESQTIGLTFDVALPAGDVALELEWTGAFCPGLRGLYRAGAVAVTQFEAADCRRVFPSLDEPAFKARWHITLEGVPDGVAALSNGAIERDEPGPQGRTITFAETPLLSSYLVALVIGNLVGSDEEDVGGVPTRTWSLPEKAHLQGFGQMCARESLPLFEDYFGLPYIFGKLDQVGVPDFEAGAMENAGCITYRETALLLDPETAPLRVKKIVAEIVTHELAHQWFGNLVTMVWWDDLWLNEAFATWMAYKIVDMWAPQWRMWMDFEVGKQSAFSLDALVSSHPIRTDVHNAEEAGEAFDAITYEKGGAVLRMIEGYIGEGAFREGIRDYMRRHREANATADDLWSALAAASDAPLRDLANDWIRRTGFPRVGLGLDREAGEVRVSQSRFLSDPDAASGDDCWMIPLVLKYADDSGERQHRAMLTQASSTIALPHQGDVRWCIGNADARGFYRTAYDPAAYAAVLEAMPQLTPAERMGLVSDMWALMNRGEIEVTDVLDLAVRLEPERDNIVLDQLVGVLAALEYRHVSDDDRHRFRAVVTQLTAGAAAELGWDAAPGEDDQRKLARAAVLRAQVAVGRDPAGVAEAARRFAQLLGGDDAAPPFDPNLLDLVVTAGMRDADANRLEELRARVGTAVDPAVRRRYLYALARVERPELARMAVDLALGDDVPMQDFAGFVAGLLQNPAARELAWERIRGDFAAFEPKIGPPMIRQRFVGSLTALVTPEHLDQVREFLAEHPMEGTRQAVDQTLERLRIAVAVRERTVPAMRAWLDARA